jgi:subfamily B ATP-binding cassette protein MsbA
MHLLPRFYEPTQGRLWLDGELLARYRLKDLRRQMALVSQNVVLFNATIAGNIAYGEQRQASREAIERAASLACVNEFADQMSHGLDTFVGDSGVSLSGGQRQRIAIARAFLKDAPILLLDEATSALDSQTEQSIQRALTRLSQNRTTIVVAHRLATVKQAHQIVVLKNGEVVERGTHQTLIQNDKEYAALYSEDRKEHVYQMEVS